MIKLLYFDCETTGLDFISDQIIEMAGVYDENGKAIRAFNLKLRPTVTSDFSSALKIQNKALEEVLAYPERQAGYKKFIDFLDGCVNRFDKEDKMYLVGYNIQFDKRFLQNLFDEFNNKYFGSYFNFECIDVLSLAAVFKLHGNMLSQNLKLSSVCQAANINLKDAHTALEDVIATRKLFIHLNERFDIKD